MIQCYTNRYTHIHTYIEVVRRTLVIHDVEIKENFLRIFMERTLCKEVGKNLSENSTSIL